MMPDEDPNSALFRIEVIRVPLDDPQSAAIVSSPRIFQDLVAPPTHGLAPDDRAVIDAARQRGAFVIEIGNQVQVLPDQIATQLLDSIMTARGGTGSPNAADSASLREWLDARVAELTAGQEGDGPQPGPTQCHDITVYPEIGLAGGACEGYGLLLDISDPANPVRVAAVADSNFAYWHSATFNNDGSTVVFTDEWGGGGAPKCRASDPYEWGANAIFEIDGTDMNFTSYYKLSAAQTPQENCVAHNGSLIPIPGRDIMIQGWYQGGISLFDFSDPSNPVEIAYHDRGPLDPNQMRMAGSWSVYWYNGYIVNSEIARGLDIFELTPSDGLSQNEIDAAKSVTLTHLNSQGQPKFVWPSTFALARAYVDQLERAQSMAQSRVDQIRRSLREAELDSGASQRSSLGALSEQLEGDVGRSSEPDRVRLLIEAVNGLAGA